MRHSFPLLSSTTLAALLALAGPCAAQVSDAGSARSNPGQAATAGSNSSNSAGLGDNRDRATNSAHPGADTQQGASRSVTYDKSSRSRRAQGPARGASSAHSGAGSTSGGAGINSGVGASSDSSTEAGTQRTDTSPGSANSRGSTRAR